MIFKYVRKQMKKSWVKTGLCILLLSVTGLLLSLGTGIFFSASKTIGNTSNLYTTIAIPNYSEIRSYAEEHPLTESNGRPVASPTLGIRLKEFEIRKNIMDMTFRESFINSDSRDYFSAYSPGLTSITSGLRDKARFEGSLDSPHTVSAFVVRCNTVIEMAGGFGRSSLVSVEVEEVVKMYSEYPAPKSIDILTSLFNSDGTPAFEEGRRYLVIGAYSPSILIEGEGHTRSLSLIEPIMGVTLLTVEDTEGGSSYTIKVPDIESPYFYRTWFELDGPLEGALSGENGGEIRTALEIAEKSIHSVRIITTDSLSSILQFNRGDAQILEGREFSASETESGAKVCVIPQGIAEYNGLGVGDSIPLEFYKSEFSEMQYDGHSRWYMRPYVPYAPELPMEEYEIVGIYQGEEWEEGIYALPPNTVFIPNKAFIGFDEPSGDIAVISDISGTPPITYSCVIENGMTDDFKSAVEKQYPGYGGFFLFFDQGYASSASALHSLSKSTAIIFLICAVIWLIALALFLLLLIGSKQNQLGMLSAMGIGKRFRFKSLFLLCSIIVLAAGVIACTFGMIVYEKAVEHSYSIAYENIYSNEDDGPLPNTENNLSQASVMEKDIWIVPVAILVQMIVVLLVSGVYIHLLLKKSVTTLLRN